MVLSHCQLSGCSLAPKGLADPQISRTPALLQALQVVLPLLFLRHGGAPSLFAAALHLRRLALLRCELRHMCLASANPLPAGLATLPQT